MAQINKPQDHFSTKLYTGTGASHSITGVGHKPDWVWIKSRSQTVNHYGFDAVRGATKGLSQNINNAESTRDSTWFNSFDSDGFTIGSEANINNSSSTYTSWNWKASNATAVANTDGSVNSSVSVNSTAGFSIVTFTTPASGTFNVGHGLSSKPELWIHKRRDGADNWQVYHHKLGNTKKIMLNVTDASTTSAIWQDTTPTDSVMYLGTAGTHLNASADYVAYCMHSVKGFSKIGEYTGQGSQFPMVYTGFRPGFLLIRKTGAVSNWIMIDCKRIGHNGDNEVLEAHGAGVEQTAVGDRLDIYSNGFVPRNSWSDINTDGSQYIYYAVAEQPLVGTNNIPATAR